MDTESPSLIKMLEKVLIEIWRMNIEKNNKNSVHN